MPLPGSVPVSPDDLESPRSRLSAAAVGIMLGWAVGFVSLFVVGFGASTACTDDYSCTETDCAPCAPVQTAYQHGAIAVGVGTLVSGVLWTMGRRRLWRSASAATVTIFAFFVTRMYAY